MLHLGMEGDGDEGTGPDDISGLMNQLPLEARFST